VGQGSWRRSLEELAGRDLPPALHPLLPPGLSPSTARCTAEPGTCGQAMRSCLGLLASSTRTLPVGSCTPKSPPKMPEHTAVGSNTAPPLPPALWPNGETEAPSYQQCPPSREAQCLQGRSASPLLQREANRIWLKPGTLVRTWLGTNVPRATRHILALGQSTQHSSCSGATRADCAPWHAAPEHPWAAGCWLHGTWHPISLLAGEVKPKESNRGWCPLGRRWQVGTVCSGQPEGCPKALGTFFLPCLIGHKEPKSLESTWPGLCTPCPSTWAGCKRKASPWPHCPLHWSDGSVPSSVPAG